MRKLIFWTILSCLSANISFGQKAKPTAAPVKSKSTVSAKSGAVQAKKDTLKPNNVSPVKSQLKPEIVKAKSASTKIAAAVKPKPVQIQKTAAISDADWKALADSLVGEDWEKSATLSSQFISRIKIDNEKKQLAQLRYLYIYALAGKLLKLAAANNAAEIAPVWEELKRAAARFTGREFLLPPRQFLGDCRQVFNYICTVKNDEKAVRSVSTDKNGTEIHSFDYVRFDQKIAFKEFKENKTFVGGTLRRVEFNEDLAKPWVMRLVFDKGFVRVVI